MFSSRKGLEWREFSRFPGDSHAQHRQTGQWRGYFEPLLHPVHVHALQDGTDDRPVSDTVRY